MPKNSNSNFYRGFTLIELLVSVSIIAILSAIGLLAYANFTKNARDSARKSDLKLTQSALENFHADQISYPEAGDGNCLAGKLNFGCSLTNLYGSKTYLNRVPKDPWEGNPQYSYQPSATGYCLFAKLEGQSQTSDPGCTPTSPYNYGVTRP